MEREEVHSLVLAHGDREERSRLCLELERAGYTICGVADDGGKLFRLVRTQRPEMVLLDLSLSYMTGLEVLRQLKEMEPQVKCLVVGAFTEKTMAQALADGASGVLCAPFSNHLLLERVKEVLSHTGSELSEDEIETGCLTILTDLQAPTRFKGYRYMMDALNIVLHDRGLIARRNVIEELYQPIARTYNATESQVERAMRNLTRRIFARSSREMLERYLPWEYVERGSISNTKFIEAVTGYIFRQHRSEQLKNWWWG